MSDAAPLDNHTIALADLSYAGGEPALQAQIKEEFSDFRVDEELGFEPTGAGEHLYLRVRKTNLSTTQAARRLAETTGVALRDVGYSGMKDRRGECTQWFSLKLPAAGEPSLAGFENPQLTVLETQRNQRKLRVGTHRHNHFRLLLRNCQGSAQEFEQRLEGLRAHGVPNYFGAQRFGREMSNIDQVVALFAQELQGDGGRARRGMLYSAARAYLFNQVLSERIAAGNWSRYLEGDVLNLDDTDRCFVVPEGGWDDSLQQRLDSFDIHLSGPLAGTVRAADKYCSRQQAAALEQAVLARFPLLVDGLKARGLEAARRPLRYRVRDLAWRWREEDRAGDRVQDREQDGIKHLALDFVLPRGAYATSLLREVCSTQEAKQE